jgi:alkaline phosphatase
MILDNDPDGFFLMVEGGLIDWACHAHDLPDTVWETIEFDNAVQEVLDWAQGRTDTLIIVTADHETGGLSVVANNGADEYPTVTWSTGGHTGANVPVYARGPNADLIYGVMDNTDFFTVATACLWDYDDDGDGDVDGEDLEAIINFFDPAKLADFAEEFGNICP